MVKVATISYLNTLPFIYGLKNHPINKQISMIECVPSVGASLLINNKVDIAIVPAAAIPFIPNHNIISDYCIGATDKVASVLLCSGVPLEDIKTLYLDTDSISSVTLSKILCKNYWKISPVFEDHKLDNNNLDFDKSYVMIGDKALQLASSFNYVYDLAQEWIKFKSKPFVFACWVANKELTPSFIKDFNEALELGLSNIDKSLEGDTKGFSKDFAYNYLTNNISYNLDSSKREGMQEFWVLALE